MAKGPVLAAGAVLLILGARGESAPEARPLRILREQALPAPPAVGRTLDIRWAGLQSIYVSTAFGGTFEIALAATKEPWLHRIFTPQTEYGPFGTQDHLALTSRIAAVAGPARGLFWQRRPSGTKSMTALNLDFDVIAALDARGAELLVLGARRNDRGEFAPDGAIAWIVQPEKQPPAVRTILYSRSGPGAPAMGDCGMFETGKVRAMPAGDFWLVPGVEPGVYHYDAAGKLLSVLQADRLGFEVGCGLTPKEVLDYSASMTGRWTWLNRRRVLDEILALPEGPGFLVRIREAAETRWELKVLRGSGEVVSYGVPIRSPSPFAHLRGDARGARLAFVLLDLDQVKPTPAGRLIVAELPPQAGLETPARPPKSTTPRASPLDR
jgi:hypothetical protein